MLNAETPRFKLGLFQPETDLGQALLAEALSRQIEVSALVEDLNALPARPGLRCRIGRLDDARAVSESVAGLDALIIGFADIPCHWLCPTIERVLSGVARAGVGRVLLVGDWNWLDRPEDHIDRGLGKRLLRSLENAHLDWTLVQSPALGENLGADDFTGQLDHAAEQARQRALGCACALLDEAQSGQFNHQRMVMRFPDEPNG
ncbi:MAG: hypothetical protein GAK45_00611 [Pseudomonas citronellolis]|nr:MAG: hypothetical protein GAK45_00611 [Pseudomonas citronellolis]